MTIASNNLAGMPLEDQVRELSNVIMFEIHGEPSQSEGAISCAIRLLRNAYCKQPNLVINECTICGTYVLNRALHSQWHEHIRSSLNNIGERADRYKPPPRIR